MKDKFVWIDAREMKEGSSFFSLIFNRDFDNLLIDIKQLSKVSFPKKINLIVEVGKEQDLDKLDPATIVLSKSTDLLKVAERRKYKTALWQKITSKEEMDFAWKNGANYDFLAVELMAETNIPIELLIAKLQNTKTSTLKLVKSTEDAIIAFGVMEAGTDGVLLKPKNTTEIVAMDHLLSQESKGKIELHPAKVKKIQYIGMGDRACIDTTSMLNTNEGMLIGSYSSGGLLVTSETIFLPYMDLRPFRVNAGAVHSYVCGKEGAMPYITDLKAGSKVLSVDTDGNTREVIVGRVKIETRPLLMITSEINNQPINTIVQDDWHIRLFGADKKVKNATCIKPGDELLGFIVESGRHVGIKIKESIIER